MMFGRWLFVALSELDVRLVTTSTGTRAQSRIGSKNARDCGPRRRAIGIGLPLDPAPLGHTGWLVIMIWMIIQELSADGVGAICDTVMNSPEPVTIIAIGPLPNLAAALVRNQDQSAQLFRGMHGSLRRVTLVRPKPCAIQREATCKRARRYLQHLGTRPSRYWTPVNIILKYISSPQKRKVRRH